MPLGLKPQCCLANQENLRPRPGSWPRGRSSSRDCQRPQRAAKDSGADRLAFHRLLGRGDGGKWHWLEAGSALNKPALLFIQGQPDSCYLWQEVALKLAFKYRSFCLDLKGLGSSTFGPGKYDYQSVAKEVLAFAENLPAASYHLVAHGKGCHVGDYMAALASNRVRTYSRCQHHLYRWGPGLSPEAGLFADLKAVAKFLADPLLFAKIWWGGKLNAGQMAPLGRELTRPGVKEAVLRYEWSNSELKMWKKRNLCLMRAWKQPVLILQAELDSYQAPGMFWEAKGKIGSCHIGFIRSAKSYFPISDPDRTAAAIDSFIAAQS